MIGDARTPPTLLASSNFTGLAVIGKHCGVPQVQFICLRRPQRCRSICPKWWRCSMVHQSRQLVCQITCKVTSRWYSHFASQLPLGTQSDHRLAPNECHCTCNWDPLASITGNLTDQCSRGNVAREWHATPRYRFLSFGFTFDEFTCMFQDFTWKVEGERKPLECSG